MGLFLSTFVNKVDKKGRVSIPATFRATLGEGQTEIIVYPSMKEPALDACSLAHLEKLSEALETPTMSPEERELIETVVFGQSVRITMDPEGRISLPDEMAAYAGITDTVTFHGRRKIFQLWNPVAFQQFQQTTRELARANNISLSSVLAKSNGLAKGE
ncbi:MraZ family transcriptional regulator [Niveispirillum sp.]|uniref:division/cell wall cluster transcriptional repressor MraZ n=1 Tax=Niveispirillum sp. TaxID=1917217 RepID=UPI001B75724B|nr:MraZ family transcriptional regulator [Niveispirillum sp.]MBP7339962.1 MraZ family transcriptional regulator [Niveispirillum sp.]